MLEISGKLRVVSLKAIWRTGEEPHEGLLRSVQGAGVCTYVGISNYPQYKNKEEKCLHERSAVLRDRGFVPAYY